MASLSRRSAPEDERASGLTQAEEIVKEESERADADIESTLDDGPHLPEDARPDRPQFRTPGFSRMRITRTPDDQIIMSGIQTAIEDRLVETFLDAYIVMNDIFEAVREPEVDASGEVVRDRHGFAVWKRKANGAWEEDWSRLTRAERENFIFEITTRLWGWEQRAADAWADSMFAKAQWEERFGIAYGTPHSGTIEDRTAYAKRDAAEERYFAIFSAAYSRKADAIVRVMATLGQRLKDTLLA